MHPLGALAAGAFLAVPSAASSSSWHDGIEHDAVAAVSEATIHDAPLFRRVGTFAFERGGEADLRAVCGEVALPGTRREYVRFVALYRREGDGWARASEPAVEGGRQTNPCARHACGRRCATSSAATHRRPARRSARRMTADGLAPRARRRIEL
jgi:hypothetical protein